MPLPLLLNGSAGRMGQTILRCAAESPADFTLHAALDAGQPIAQHIAGAAVVIDFSHHSALPGLLAACLAHHVPLVIGTTGYSDDDETAIRDASARIPIVYASNYSVGVNTLFWLAEKATEILGPAFDLEIVEMHHRLKKDAPSGTARTLAQILAHARGLSYNQHVAHGRHGLPGERPADEIGMHSLRGGDVIGDHTVIYAALGERVELTHKASSRETFARGALRAAQWATTRPPALYDMQHVLGLK